MKAQRIVGLTGGFDRNSRTYSLVERAVLQAREHYVLEHCLLTLDDLGPSLQCARRPADLDASAHAVIDEIVQADLLVIGVPTYNAGYPGMFKHLFDLIGPDVLAGKPVLLLATGGSERHALMIDYQLRPLFSYLRTHVLPTAIYATGAQFDGLNIADEEVLARIGRAVREFGRWAVDRIDVSATGTRPLGQHELANAAPLEAHRLPCAQNALPAGL